MKKLILLSYKPLLLLGFIALLLSSCVPQKKMLYMQVKTDTDTLTAFKNEKLIDYRVQPGDNLYVRVVSLDEQTTLLLNPSGTANNMNSDASIYLNSYTVNETGYFDFPMTGAIFVKNMNVEEIKEALNEELKVYLKEFVVIVKLVNFNITLIGEVNRPGQYKIYQNSISIFEAVAMSGDLTDFANRNKIAIIRQTKTGSEVTYIDMTKRDVLASDYYFLKPNDIIYAQPVRGKQFSFAEFPYAVIFGAITTTILLLNYFQ